MTAVGFFSSEYYEQSVKIQEILDALSDENFNESLEQFLSYPSADSVKTIASSLLNRIKIKPQDADLVIDFIEKYDESIESDRLSYRNHSKIMPIFTKIVNPMSLHDHTYNTELYNTESQYKGDDNFMPIPVSESFIYENLRQRGHISFDIEDYNKFLKMKEKMSHLYLVNRKYEVDRYYNFIKTAQFIHLMPEDDYKDFVLKCNSKNFYYPDPFFNEFSYGYFTFEDLSQNDFELHKKYLRSGFNPFGIAPVIRNDDVEEFERYILDHREVFQKKISLSIYDCNVLLKDANVLEYAAYFGSIEIFNYIIKNAPNIDDLFTQRLVNFAVISGNPEIYDRIDDYFTLRQPNVNVFQYSLPFSLAFHHNEITERLIYFKNCQSSPDIFESSDIYSPTLNCLYYANWRDMNFLLHNDESNLPLFLLASAMFNNEELFKNLLEIPKIDLNVKYDKMAPINFLVRYDNDELISLLIEKGKLVGERKVDLNNRGFRFYTPIIYTCYYQLFDSFSVLIQEKDVDVNESFFWDNDSTNTILTYSLKFRQYQMSRMILRHPKLDIKQSIRELQKSPLNNNIMLSLNYLLDEKKREKKKDLKKIDVSSLEI